MVVMSGSSSAKIRLCYFAERRHVVSRGFRREFCHRVYGQNQNGKKPKNNVKEESPYRKTVQLPQTDFNLRANSLQREPELQQFWNDQKIYESLVDSNKGEIYTLHDGPPYANGDLHIGHALNKILKDFIVKYQLLKRKKAAYVPGWDTHGLPIELKVLQGLKKSEAQNLTPLQLRQKAKDFALETVDKQRESFKRFGVWGDWDNPYVTLDPSFEAAQIGVFGAMVEKGHIYRGRKPVHWSPSSRTALAEAELEYPEGHTSKSIYVAMPITELGSNIPSDMQQHIEGSALAIWTTTPWTIPANLAVAVNNKLIYLVASIADNGQKVIIAKDLLEILQDKWQKSLTIVCEFEGAALEGCKYKHPLFDRISPVVIGGDYITTESGTGLVHTAPGHGQEDYQVGLRNSLEILSPVDDAGRFTSEAGEQFVGMSVLKEGNDALVEALDNSGKLIKVEAYQHKYPYDWRTKKPTIFRATDQWFASVEFFRDEALKAIQGVNWVPSAGLKRISSMTEGRSDWCISRQRKWGVPIPVFYDKETGDPLMTTETIKYIQQIIADKGCDAWWELDVADLLPPSLKADADKYIKGEDTMDVWFDSGSSWAGVVEANPKLQFPADLYLEGSDQHRGWFQSSLLTAVAARGQAPYRNVVTHGFVLDEKGNKMSKSLGNVIDPKLVIEGGNNKKKQPGYGADVLRLWVSSVDYSADVMIGDNILKSIAETYRKIRGTIRFLLGNIYDIKPAQFVLYDKLPVMDKMILGRCCQLMNEVDQAYQSYQFSRVFQQVRQFISVDLSNVYLDIAKDRLYIRGADTFERRSCQTTLYYLTISMLSMLAPLLPHLAEDAWMNFPSIFKEVEDQKKSVFNLGWFQPPEEWESTQELEDVWRAITVLRDLVNGVLENARTDKMLGASLEAKVYLFVQNKEVRDKLIALQKSGNGVDEWRYIFITSQAYFVDNTDQISKQEYNRSLEDENLGPISVGVSRADGQKCARCWNYDVSVGNFSDHPELCQRCIPVVRDLGFVLPQSEQELQEEVATGVL